MKRDVEKARSFEIPAAFISGIAATLFLFAVGHSSSAFAEVENVSSLPYSYQWTFERSNSFLYLQYGELTLGSPILSSSGPQMGAGLYSNFQGTRVGMVGVDYFSNILYFAPATSSSFLRRLALEGRYALGFGEKEGKLLDSSVALSNAGKTSLLLVSGSVGLGLQYEATSWFQPYLTAGIRPYFYRVSATLSGAENENTSLLYDLSLGAHFPLFFSGRASVLAELRHESAPATAHQLFVSENVFVGGLGMVF
jgi:opacity protein-like surface antigen